MKIVKRTAVVIISVILLAIVCIKVFLVLMLPDASLKRYLEKETSKNFDEFYYTFGESTFKSNRGMNDERILKDVQCVCIYNNALYYFTSPKYTTAVLMSVDLTTKEHRNILSIQIPIKLYRTELCVRTVESSYTGEYCHAYCYDNNIVIECNDNTTLYNLATGKITEIETSSLHDPREEYKSIEVEKEQITIVPKQGEVRTLTAERMAEMDDAAKKLYKYSQNKTSVFSPKIKMEFERVAFYNDEMYIVMLIYDAGGWAYLVYYHYVPESDALDFWCGMFINDAADSDEVSVLPYAE